jgi:hypothetical protein
LEGLAVEDIGIFMAILSTYFTAKWYILWPFGTFCGHLLHFPHFGMLCLEKSGNPGSKSRGSNEVINFACMNSIPLFCRPSPKFSKHFEVQG